MLREIVLAAALSITPVLAQEVAQPTTYIFQGENDQKVAKPGELMEGYNKTIREVRQNFEYSLAQRGTSDQAGPVSELTMQNIVATNHAAKGYARIAPMLQSYIKANKFDNNEMNTLVLDSIGVLDYLIDHHTMYLNEAHTTEVGRLGRRDPLATTNAYQLNIIRSRRVSYLATAHTLLRAVERSSSLKKIAEHRNLGHTRFMLSYTGLSSKIKEILSKDLTTLPKKIQEISRKVLKSGSALSPKYVQNLKKAIESLPPGRHSLNRVLHGIGEADLHVEEEEED